VRTNTAQGSADSASCDDDHPCLGANCGPFGALHWLDMRWLIVLAAIVAAAVAIQMIVWERRGRIRPSTVTGLASVGLTLIVMIAVAYVARGLGIFTVAIVVVAFVPFGFAARGLLFATRESRLRAAQSRASAAPPPSRRARLLSLAAWPVFLAMVAVAVALGLAAATFVGPH